MIGTAVASASMNTALALNHANQIRPFQRSEMASLARTELNQFLTLAESLQADDWTQPTDCTAWNVRAVVAHQASHPKAAASAWEFFDQFNPLKFLSYIARGMNLLDAANQRQVDIRAHHSTTELIAEIRDYGEPSIEKRQRFPFFIRMIKMPVPGQHFTVSVADLLDVIFTRDMWMHRYDIARATKRDFVRSTEHDGRIVELIVRELQSALLVALLSKSVIYHLTGTGGGSWQLGGNATPEATITLDVMEFNRLASGRVTADTLLQTKILSIDGNTEFAMQALKATAVLY
jgi:uncharacterized protein (TIGR03083 family)